VRPRRRFDQARPVQDTTRINEAIRASKVRLVDEDGSQVGVKTRDEALE
jgi:translation initiation factor IF-3